MRFNLDHSIGNVRALLDQFATDGHRNGMAVGDAQSTVDLYMKIHRQIRADVSGAYRVSVLDTVDLEGKLLDMPAGGRRRTGIDQLIQSRAEDSPRRLEDEQAHDYRADPVDYRPLGSNQRHRNCRRRRN